jgi:hypothetical protein
MNRLISSAALPPVGSHALLRILCSQFVDFLLFSRQIVDFLLLMWIRSSGRLQV